MRERNFYPPEGHDFVHTPDTRRISEENKIRQESKLFDDLAIFRAKLYQKMLRHSALDYEGSGWAIFDTYAENQVVGDITTSVDRDVLVITGPLNGANRRVIRMITNEAIATSSLLSIIAYDITIDSDDDVQYFVDALDSSRRDTHAPHFFPEGFNKLHLSDNFKGAFTPVINLDGDYSGRDDILPFGHYEVLEDKIHALQVANDVLAEIMPYDPVAKQRV